MSNRPNKSSYQFVYTLEYQINRIKGKGGRSHKKKKGEGVIKEEGDRSPKKNKRWGCNKRGQWQIGIHNE